MMDTKDLKFSAAASFRISAASSVLVGLSAAYSAYVLFLQTPVVSESRLAAGCILLIVFAVANFLFTHYYLKEKVVVAFSSKPYILGLCVLIPLFIPPALVYGARISG